MAKFWTEDRGRVDDRGMVTLEIAMAVPILLVMCLSLVWFVNVGRLTALAQDAARSSVRELARGADRATARDEARRILPDAQVEVSRLGGFAKVVVSKTVRGPQPILDRFSQPIRGQAVGPMENPW